MKRFEEVKQRLERNIIDGRYAVGAPLPRLERLAADELCSVATVRRAIRDLIDAGVVESAKKRGTVVLRKPAAGRVVLCASTDTHTNMILQAAVCNALAQAGFDLDVLVLSTDLDATENWCRRLLSGRPIDALIHLGHGAELPPGAHAMLHELFARHIYVVIDALDLAIDQTTSVVLTDADSEIESLAEFARGRGHRRIAIWRSHVPDERLSRLHTYVADGLRERWEREGGSCLFHYAVNGLAGVLQLIREQGVTAYVDLNDFQAVSTLAGLQANGLSVPEDVAIIGRNDTPWATTTTPELSSLSLNPQGIASAVVAAAQAFATDPSHGEVYRVSRTVVARASA